MQRGLKHVSKCEKMDPACRVLYLAARFGGKDGWDGRSGEKVLTRSPLHHRGIDLEVPWLIIRATASVWLCGSLLGLQDDGVARQSGRL